MGTEVILRPTLVVTFTKREFGLRGKAKVAVGEQSFATKRKIEPFSFMDSPKTKNQIYQRKN